MKLTRLRLIGFKSFVEPTDFLIEPGLTGVVGPNGCGKSNLVEALRWVMGESSYKSMRASSMDDVIFSGNNNRPARNNAEVAIAIDNSERSAPAAFNEQDAIDIARRIEREAGSTYRINGREVRARDVQILFADASTGARSPALVHQGRIGEIIQAKPEQRRRVLEEAAGVSGLHARRHEAELRLKAAETNLLRLEDVIGQLASQIDGLKKQARQAIRYRTVSAQVRKSEATLYHLRWTAATIEVAEAEQAKDVCVREVATRVGAEAEASKRQALAAASLPELREAEARAGAALHRLNVALQDLDREEARAKDRIAELDLRLVQFAADGEREQKLAADAEAALARLAAEEDTIRKEARRKRRPPQRRRCQGGEGRWRTHRRRKDLLRSDHRARRSHRAAQSVRERRARARRAHRANHGRNRGDRARTGDAQERRQCARSPPRSRARRPRSPRRKPPPLRRGRAHQRARRSRSRARRVRRSRKARAAAGNRGEDARQDALAGNAQSVAAGDRPCLGRQRLREGAGRRARRRSRRAGRCLRADALGESRRSMPATRPCRKASSRSRAMCRRRRNWPAGWRRSAWSTARPAASSPHAQARPAAGLARRRSVALGRLRGGRACADRRRASAGGAQPPCRDRRRTGQRPAPRSRTSARALDAAQAAFDAAGHAESETRARASASSTARRARLSALAEARTRLTASRDEASAAKAEAERALAALAPAAELESKLAAVRDDITGKRAKLAEVRAEQQAIVREAELADRRLAALATDKAGWIERRDGARNQIATLEQRIAEAKRDRAELENAPQMFAEKRQALISEVANAEAERRACADRLQEAENALAEADRDARAALEAASAAREELARAEERFEGAKRRLADIGREIHDMLEIEPSAVAELAGIKPGEALPELAEIEAKLERLRRERERLGAVNLRAEEELREVETQHTSLTTERDDLVEAIKKLRWASRASTARRASGCWPRSNRSTSTSSSCSRGCSAAAPPNCS